MEPGLTSARPQQLGRANEARLSKLRRVLRETPGFAFLIVTVEAGPLRAEVLRRLAVWSGVDGVPGMRVAAADRAEPLAELASGGGLVLVEPDDSTSAAQIELAQRLNWQRDGMLRAVPGPLVLVVGRAGHQALFEQAPDLYSWRRHSVAITPEFSALFAYDKPRSTERYRAQRLHLEQTLAQLSELGSLPALAQAELRVRIGALMVREGLGREAEAILKETLEIFRREGDLVGEMMALLGSAEAALIQGDRERAEYLLESTVQRKPVESFVELDEPSGRFGTAGVGVAVRMAMLSAYLRIDRDPMQVLLDLEHVENVRCEADAKADLLLMQGFVLQRLGNFEAAAEKLEQAGVLYDDLGDGLGQTLSFATLSMLHRTQGHVPEALQVAQRLKERTAAWPDLQRVAVDALVVAALREIGPTAQDFVNAHDQLNPDVARAMSPVLAMLAAKAALERNHDETAVQKLQEAESALAGLPSAYTRDAMVSLMRHRAEVEAALGDLTAAAATAEALEVLVDPSSRTNRGRARLLRAAIAANRGAATEALELFRSAESDLSDGDDIESLAGARLGQGWIFLEQGRKDDAIERLELARQAFLDLGRLEECQRTENLLIMACTDFSLGPDND